VRLGALGYWACGSGLVRTVATTANTYSHVMADETEVVYADLLVLRPAA
jgi:hypothetical protein